MQQNGRSFLGIALGAGFLVILAVPGVHVFLEGSANVARAGELERRRPPVLPGAPKSYAEAREFPRRVDEWVEDAWGGRERALRANARASKKFFRTSPAPHLEFGRRGWIFSRESDAFESFTGVAPLPDSLLRDWQRALEDRRRWLAERDIEHLVVFVPHKSSIYPERLRASIEGARGVSRLEQFQAWMGRHSDVRIIDVAPSLLARKELDDDRQHVYSPHGVHWTAVGAHAAYEVVAGLLADELGAPPPVPLESFEIVDRPGDGDSWARRMYLDRDIDMENLWLVAKEPTRVVEVENVPQGGPKDRRWKHPDRTRPRVVVVHDSFGPDILPLLALNASLLEARWRSFLETRVVERVRPNVVIELYSELALVTQTPFRRPAFLGPEVAEQFATARSVRRVAAREFPTRARVEYVDLGALDVPWEAEVLLGLRLECDRPGTIGVYRGHELSSATPIAHILPVDIPSDGGTRHVPLPRAEPGARTWLVLPKVLGAVRLESAEFRVTARER